MTTPSVPAPLLVLTWAVSVGAVLAPSGAGAVEVRAPRTAPPGGALELPAAVRAALASDWRAVRVALDTAHASLGELHPDLGAHALPGWPVVGAAVLTVAAWAAAVRATFDEDEAAGWDERAGIYEADADVPRWVAECQAVEDVVQHRMAAWRAYDAGVGAPSNQAAA